MLEKRNSKDIQTINYKIEGKVKENANSERNEEEMIHSEKIRYKNADEIYE